MRGTAMGKCTKSCIWKQQGSDCMRSIRLFKGLSDEARMELHRSSIVSMHAKGSVLAQEGTENNSILILRRGRVKTCRVDPEGNEHILDVLHGGQAIWHGMFTNDPVYHYSVICLEDTEVCEIRREDFLRVFSRHPDAAMNMITMLSTELDDAEEKVMLLGIRNPRQRLAGFLLYRDTRCLGTEIHMKLEDIASSVNLRLETVSRILREMEKRNLIQRTGRGRLKVLDREVLKQYQEETDS